MNWIHQYIFKYIMILADMAGFSQYSFSFIQCKKIFNQLRYLETDCISKPPLQINVAVWLKPASGMQELPSVN